MAATVGQLGVRECMGIDVPIPLICFPFPVLESPDPPVLLSSPLSLVSPFLFLSRALLSLIPFFDTKSLSGVFRLLIQVLPLHMPLQFNFQIISTGCT